MRDIERMRSTIELKGILLMQAPTTDWVQTEASSTELNAARVINVHSRNFLVMLTLIVRLAACSMGLILSRPLKTKQLVHLIHAQSLGVVDEEPSIDTCADQASSKEDIYAPTHACVHLWQCLGDYKGPNPDTRSCERSRDRAQGGRKDLC